jgi:hypothetical protein
MKPEEYGERRVRVGDWEVNLTTYKLGGVYHCQADNVSPGACLARRTGPTREAAEALALERAGELLAGTRRRDTGVGREIGN